jgi:N-methylhydantoinase A
VTDANLVLGYLGGGDLAGGVGLDRGAAERAVGGLARELDLDLVDCAEGIARVATAEMAQALRVMTVERGVDPRGYALLAFGGAGPMHAAAIAEELGMERILCPPTSGVLAALGLVVGERRRDAQRSLLLSGDELTPESVSEAFGELAGRARDALGEPDAPLRAAYDLRYRGQAFELPVERDGNEPASPQELREGFAAAFAERYGYTEDEAGVELVTLRVTAALPGPEVSLERAAGAAPRPRSRPGRRYSTARAWRRPCGGASWRRGTRLEGPAVCELPEATLVVAPGWTGEVDATGAVGLERS